MPIFVASQKSKVSDLDIQGAFARLKEDLICEALVRFKGNKKKVTEELGISGPYLYKKLNLSS